MVLRFDIIEELEVNMAKKKIEHIVFDQTLKPKKNIPFTKINKQNPKKQKSKG